MGGVLRTAAAFLVCPAVFPAGLWVISAAFPEVEMLRGLYLPVICIGYLSAVMFGIPALILMRRNKWTRLRHFMLAGVSIGMVAYSMLFLPSAIFELEYGALNAVAVLRNSLNFALVAAISGWIASSFFWAFSRGGDVALATEAGD